MNHDVNMENGPTPVNIPLLACGNDSLTMPEVHVIQQVVADGGC